MPKLPLGPDDRVVLAGASGLIGRALSSLIEETGARVTTLVRREPSSIGEVMWDPSDGLDPEVLRGARAVVVLNGASIGRLPWTRSYRSELLWSRLTPIRAVVRALRDLDGERPALLTASAVGFYGSVPGRTISESAEAGTGFLADLCTIIEEAARDAEDITAVTRLRIAPVIHPNGVLRPLLVLTRLGVSGPLGSGKQTWPWISLPDVVRAMVHAIEHAVTGPVNLTGPTRATANDVGFALAVAMNRPYLVPAPAFALRAALGDAADGLLLCDADVIPRRLSDTGFTWLHGTADEAVRHAVSTRS